ncbi:MAG: VTT domain-containing protein [Candidatus Methylopumilus sp.]
MELVWGMLSLGLNQQQHINTVIAMHGDLTYAILFLIVFCEMGLLPLFFLPGDPLLFFCGALCAVGVLNLWILIPVLVVAAILGSLLNYWIGRQMLRKFGLRIFSHQHKWLDQTALKKSHAFYEKYGRITFILSPFIAVVRTFAPFVGGISAMTFSKFLYSMTTGAVIWVGSLVVGGYFFGNIPVIRDHVSAIVLLGLGLGLGSLAVSALLKAYRSKNLHS